MSPSGVETTLPVQWCEVNDPSEVPNSVPTCGVPEYAVPSSGSDTLIELELDAELAAELEDEDGLEDEVALVVAACVVALFVGLALVVALVDAVAVLWTFVLVEAVIFDLSATRT